MMKTTQTSLWERRAYCTTLFVCGGVERCVAKTGSKILSFASEWLLHILHHISQRLKFFFFLSF